MKTLRGRNAPRSWRENAIRLGLRQTEWDDAAPFVAVLGGSETFGKNVAHPYPALLSDWIGLPVVNLGVMHAGVSLFSHESWLLDVASASRLTVIQITGAQNMSNRLYCVHPRRNDRFLTGSAPLRELYPEIDFMDYSFMGHMMASLRDCSASRFAKVLEELQWAWVQRMRRVIGSIEGDVVLLWMSERSPDDAIEADGDPLFVTRHMLDDLSDEIAGLAEVVLPRDAGAPEAMPFACGRGDAPLHARVAEVLAETVAPLLGANEKSPRRVARAFSESGFVASQSFSVSSGTAVKRSATSP